MQGHRSMPILHVKDVDKSAEFYRDALGFDVAGTWKDDAGLSTFSIVQMDQITVGLMLKEDASGSDGHWASYFYINDINAFADHVEGKGVALTRQIEDQPYGCRDCDVTDPDGNLLCFGQDMSPGGDGPGL